MSESTSRPRQRNFSFVAAILIMLLVCGPLARAQNATVGSKRVSASKKPGTSRPDLQRFRARVDAALADSRASKAFWGILIADRDTGQTLYELNADKFFTPASNVKIFTSALVLSTLPRDFRFHTTLETAGQLGADGRLAGDLILVGHGDPDFSNRKFPYAGKIEREGAADAPLVEMANQAVAKGLKAVDGDIVADDSYFPYDPYPAGWSVGDLFFTFGAPVSTLAFNDNSFSIEVSAGLREGEAAAAIVEPAAASGGFVYQVSTGASNGKPDFSVVRQPGQNFILLRGSIPAGHAPIKLDFAMTDPEETAADTLKQILEARGIKVTGGVRVKHAEPPLPFDSASVPVGGIGLFPEPVTANSNAAQIVSVLILADHVSPPLLESIGVTNNVSQNLHAELFLRSVARVN